MLTWSAIVLPALVGLRVVSELSPSSLLGNASARASKVVTSFLFGLRRRGFEDVDFVTLEINCACLIRLLSFFEVGKSDSDCSAIEDDPAFCFKIDLVGCADWLGIDRRGAMSG